MGRLVVVAHGLYLARHLVTLYVIYFQYPGSIYRAVEGGKLWWCSETIQAEDNFSSKKFADLAAGRPLASAATHKRRRKDRDAVHDALLQALMDGVGSTHDKLMGLEAIDSKSGLF